MQTYYYDFASDNCNFRRRALSIDAENDAIAVERLQKKHDDLLIVYVEVSEGSFRTVWEYKG